ncbi:MAG: RNA 2',3'-cyclic phosphodiesterase [Clostridiales bacterium]|nr:RNA 2',3'-cyclic phosphodiesterase [Clostridiales bacterium]
MRLFIAVNFNNDTKSRLLALRDELRDKSSDGNFSLPENLHLTLVFLGECDERQAAAVKSVIGRVRFAPFGIAIDRIGRFKRDGGDIWWAGVRENQPLMDLQGELTDKLVEAGFGLEKRRYSAHVTLGRRVETSMRPRGLEPFGEAVEAIDLMRSERVNGKLTYTSIYKKGC